MTRIEGASASATHSLAAHLRVGDESLAQSGRNITAVRNVPRDAHDASRKQGYLFLPRIGDDTALVVGRHAATRLLDGKPPVPVIVANARDAAVFHERMEDYHDAVGEDLEAGYEPAWMEKLQAAHEASGPGGILVIDASESGVIGTLDPDQKLYVFAHGQPGRDGIVYFEDGEERTLSSADLADQLKRAGLQPHHRDVRLFACNGATLGEEGGPSSGELLTAALGRAGFKHVEVGAYPGPIQFFADRLDDGRFHRTVLMGEQGTPVQASTVRQVYRYTEGETTNLDYINLSDWRQLHDTASDTPPPLPPRNYEGAS